MTDEATIKRKENPIYQAQAVLSRRDHSESEVRTKLAKKGFEEQQIDEGIEYLKENRLLDDERFARMYIENALRFKLVGPRLLSMQLKQKGIADQYIEPAILDVLDQDKEEEIARAAAEKWQRSHTKHSGDRNRLQRFLLTRGFSFDAIQNAIDGLVD